MHNQCRYTYVFEGRLDDDTQQYMSKPRCGFQDKTWTAPYSQSRPKRYLLQGK